MRLLKPVLCALCAAGGALVWLGFLAVLLGKAIYADALEFIDSAFDDRFGDW